MRSIHENNTDFTILTFLPYHAAPIFPTFLSILPNELSATFRFLHPYQSSLTNIPRAALVQTATQQQTFLALLNRYVLDRAQAQQQYSGLIQLWASVVVQAIEARLSSSLSGRQQVQSQKQQDLLDQLLPTLNAALSITKAPELALGSYMIILVLSSKIDLNDAALDGFVQAICKSWSPETVDAGIGCIAALMERKALPRIPSRVLHAFLSIEELNERLMVLGREQSVARLALSICFGIVDRVYKAHDEEPTASQFLLAAAKATYLTAPTKKALSTHIANARKESTIDRTSLSTLESCQQLLRQASDDSGKNQDYLQLEAPPDEDVFIVGGHDLTDEAADAALENVLKPTRKSKVQKSFFARCEDALYEDLAIVFSTCIGREERASKFLQAPVLCPKGAATSWIRLSFLMRTAILHRNSRERLYSSKLCLHELGQLESERAPIDLQATIPYALMLLADGNAAIRRIAGQMFRKIRQISASTTASTEAEQWGRGNMYEGDSESTSTNWISSSLAIDFIDKFIEPSLEECAVDQSHIQRMLVRALDDAASHSSQGKKKRMKSEQREQVFRWLCSHIHSIGVLELKLRLLALINDVSKSGGQYRSKFLLPVLAAWAAEDLHIAETTMDAHSTLQSANTEFMRIVHAHDNAALQNLQQLAVTTTNKRADIQQSAFDRISSIWKLLREEKQISFAKFLLDTLTSSQDAISKSSASATLGQIALSDEVLVALLEESIASFESKEPASKRRRGDNLAIPEQSPEVKTNVARLTLTLEQIEGSQSLGGVKLFYTLFRALQVVHDFTHHHNTSLTYVVELVLTGLSGMVPNIEEETRGEQLDSSIVRTDLLVDCIRNSSNAQSRNSALLLLSSLAKKVPQQVLHTVMPIFTLMSSSSVTQNDDFTIHVVDQTIQEVVPLMVESLHQQKRDIVSGTAEILLSFAGAFEHIPHSRRQHLFTMLISSLGAQDTLFAVLATLKDHSPGNLDLPHFSVQLMQHFSATVCMKTIVKYLELCTNFFSPKKTLYQVLIKSDTASTDPAEGFSRLLGLLASVLKNKSLQSKIRNDAIEQQTSASIQEDYGVALDLVIKLSRLSQDDQRSKAACPKVLEGLLNLLPFPDFVSAVQPLLENVDADLSRSVVRALELQVRTGSHQSQESRESALSCVPRLVGILQAADSAALKHSTVACLNTICEKFGKIDQTATFAAAGAVSSQVCTSGDDNMLCTLSLHCLATTIEILRNEFIPLLQTTLDAASESLQRSLTLKDVRLHNAAYAVLVATIEQVPFVVSAKSLASAFRHSQTSAMAGLGLEADEGRQHFLEMAATKLDLAVTCELALMVWDDAIASGYLALLELVKCCTTTIDNRGKSVISRNTRYVFKFFMKVLDIRACIASSRGDAGYTELQIAHVEKNVINALLATVFKINDTVFRPFFTQILEWTTSEGKKGDTATRRSITFFNFLQMLSDKLRSLVTTYFGYAVERASDILKVSSRNANEQVLQSSVLRALKSSFANDQDEFWQSPARFSVILGPLMQQLASSNLQKVTAEVVPAITELGSCANSPDNLKEMNTLLLKHFRSDSAKSRLGAVKCQQSLTDSLGEDWLSLLPEMLPLISELQEDDDERVERETHKWIKAIEGLLGESLDAMLQ